MDKMTDGAKVVVEVWRCASVSNHSDSELEAIQNFSCRSETVTTKSKVCVKPACYLHMIVDL